MLILLSGSGCCVPANYLVWDTEFKGEVHNLSGDGRSGPSPDNGVTQILRNVGPGNDAIAIHTVGRVAEIVIVCHLPADPAHRGYSIGGRTGSNAVEAWLIRDSTYITDAPKPLAFANLAYDERRQVPGACRMVGDMQLDALWTTRQGEQVKTLTLNLRSADPPTPFAFPRTPFGDDCKSENDMSKRWPVSPQPAICNGEISGHWIRPCHIVPFI